MGRLGIEFLTMLGLPPVESIRLARDFGCDNISMMLSGNYVNPNGYPDFDLREDAALRDEVIAALRDNDVTVSLGEGLLVRPDGDVRDLERDLALMRALGAERINVVSLDPDLDRTLDQYAILAEMAAAAGIGETVTEFAPVLTVRDLPMALDAVRHVGRPDFKLLIDTMHLCRTGGTAADLAALNPGLIGYVQLCDATKIPAIADYMEESMTERLAPGAGELALDNILAVVPRDIVVSVEVPQVGRALAGESRRDIVGSIVEAARAMLNGRPGGIVDAPSAADEFVCRYGPS